MSKLLSKLVSGLAAAAIICTVIITPVMAESPLTLDELRYELQAQCQKKMSNVAEKLLLRTLEKGVLKTYCSLVAKNLTHEDVTTILDTDGLAAMGLVGDDLAGLTETLNSNGGQMVVQIMQFGIHVYVAPLIEGDILLWHLYFPDLKQPPTRKQEPSKKKRQMYCLTGCRSA